MGFQTEPNAPPRPVPIIVVMKPVRSAQPQWVETARRLRDVRRACLNFLDRWAVGALLNDAPALDRVAIDIRQARTEAAIADPANRDWSILYRGSLLDD